MKLGTKLALLNSISKVIIVVIFAVSLPIIFERIQYKLIDSRLMAKKEKTMRLIKQGGVSEIVQEEDCSYGNYTLLKQEYLYVYPLEKYENILHIENTVRVIENEEYEFRTLSCSFIYDNQYYLVEIGEGLLSIVLIDRTLRIFSIGILVTVVLLSILLDISLIRLALKPFQLIIRKKLHQVNHPNEFDTTPITTSTDEFAHLDESINELMYKVKGAFQIEKEFIANASHELLTPISIIKNKLENLIADESLPNNAAIKIVETQRTLERLTKIVRSLLLISKIENEQYLKTDNVDIVALLDEITEEISERLSFKNLSLEKQYTTEITLSECNKTLLFTMFFNIINNAIKYNKADGKILIETGIEGDKKFVKISDTGVGIEEENIPLIFNRFKKINQQNTQLEQDSYGLGLPIVKTIATFHQLQISVSSVIGSGSSFTILFNK